MKDITKMETIRKFAGCTGRRTAVMVLAVLLAAVSLLPAYAAENTGTEKQTAGCEEEYAGSAGEKQPTQWYDEYVDYVMSRGWMENLDDGTFGPEKTMTRAMFVSALYSMVQADAKENNGGLTTEEGEKFSSAEELFEDVKGDERFVPALEWAANRGVVSGIDGDFRPDLTINREMMAVMIRRAAPYLEISSEGDWSISIDYTDLEEISEWAVDGIAFCAVFEIMKGNPDGSFAPGRGLTRAEAAAVLQRIAILRDGESAAA